MLPPELICMLKEFLCGEDLYIFGLTCQYVNNARISKTQKQLRRCGIWFNPSNFCLYCQHVCCLKYLTPSLTIENIRSNNNMALQWAVTLGNLSVVRYICETEFSGQKLTIADIRGNHNYMLHSAIHSGCLSTVRYLCETEFSGQKLTMEDIRCRDYPALCPAILFGNLSIVIYFCETTFSGQQLTVDDVKPVLESAKHSIKGMVGIDNETDYQQEMAIAYLCEKYKINN